jgi:hypothetical protein
VNQRQKIALVACLTAFALWSAYPEWERPLSQSPYVTEHFGHAWLWAGPRSTTRDCERILPIAEQRSLVVAGSAKRFSYWLKGERPLDDLLELAKRLRSVDPIEQAFAATDSARTPSKLMEQAIGLCSRADSLLEQAGVYVPTLSYRIDNVRIALRPLLIGWAIVSAVAVALVFTLGLTSNQKSSALPVSKLPEPTTSLSADEKSKTDADTQRPPAIAMLLHSETGSRASIVALLLLVGLIILIATLA